MYIAYTSKVHASKYLQSNLTYRFDISQAYSFPVANDNQSDTYSMQRHGHLLIKKLSYLSSCFKFQYTFTKY